MLLLAEYVPATMLDPKALGTAFDIHWLLFYVLWNVCCCFMFMFFAAECLSGLPKTEILFFFYT